MTTNLPTTAQVRAALRKLGNAQMQELAGRSGVPFTTLLKVRQGVTENPGLETVGKFYPLIAEVMQAA